MDVLFLGLLLFAPVAIGAAIAGFSPVVVFFLSALAIVPLAKYRQVGRRGLRPFKIRQLAAC